MNILRRLLGSLTGRDKRQEARRPKRRSPIQPETLENRTSLSQVNIGVASLVPSSAEVRSVVTGNTRPASLNVALQTNQAGAVSINTRSPVVAHTPLIASSDASVKVEVKDQTGTELDILHGSLPRYPNAVDGT
jgi:hypothetical protein